MAGTKRVLEEVVHYELAKEPPPGRFAVKKDWAHLTSAPQKKVQVFVLDDSEYRRGIKPRPSLLAAPYEWDIDAYLTALREWFDHPTSHHGFGEPDDWVRDSGGNANYALLEDLDCLLEGSYRYTDLEYRIRYEIEHDARLKHGLSPYFAVKQAIHVFRTLGQGKALEYLDSLDTTSWNCVDQAIRSYTTRRINGWAGDGLPPGLAYTKGIRHLLSIHDNGRAYLFDYADHE